MGRMYSIEFENIAVTAAQDFFEISPAANKPVAIHEVGLSQSTDVGDAAEELLRIQVIRGFTATGSGGASVTPTPLSPADTASGATCERNNTTPATTGTGLSVYSGSFNIRVGLEKIWTPETRPVTINGTLVVVRLLSTPADSLSMGGYVYFEELS
jgi:hypothetical protein